jgi:hypothetical protein
MTRALLCITALAVLVTAQAPAEEPILDYAAGECKVVGLKHLIGKQATKARLNAALKTSKAKELRARRAGQAVTQDYRTDRLNIITDRRNIIRRIACG